MSGCPALLRCRMESVCGAALRVLLRIPPGIPFNAADFLRLGENLVLSNKGIGNLESIGNTTPVKNLNLSGNNIRNFFQLEPLPVLTDFNAANNLAAIKSGTANDRVLNTLADWGVNVVRGKQC